jgi:alpha-amylase
LVKLIDSKVTMIGFNYETLGEHLYHDAGILNFVRDLLSLLTNDKTITFSFASEAINSISIAPIRSIPTSTSWSAENDLSSWLGNDMQEEAFNLLKIKSEKIAQVSESLLDAWRAFQASDHYAFMSTNKSKSNLSHDYFNFYPSPYEAFINYMNALNDFSLNLQTAPVKAEDDEHAKSMEYERQHPKVPVWAMQKELRNRPATELNV